MKLWLKILIGLVVIFFAAILYLDSVTFVNKDSSDVKLCKEICIKKNQTYDSISHATFTWEEDTCNCKDEIGIKVKYLI